jgi:hypothetical protein
MQLEQRSVFRQESLDRMASPEQLDDYIKVVKPGLWIVIAAILALAVSVCVWGFTGTIPSTLNVAGYIDGEGNVTCYIPPELVSDDLAGKAATVILPDGQRLDSSVEIISPLPFSAQEIRRQVQSDWVVDSILTGNYAYEVRLKPVGEAGNTANMLISATLIIAEIKPIQLITG